MINTLKRFTRPYRWLYRMLKQGAWSEVEFPYSQLHFGQFGEDCILMSLFARLQTGFFIDVGAFHPIYFSNTHQLSKLGWTGINIEPNPESFKLFPVMRPQDTNLNVAVAGNNEQRVFVCDGPYSGFCDCANTEFRQIISDSYDSPAGKRTVQVKTLKLAEVVAEYVPRGVSVDLITIDCEGSDLSVLQSADWSSFRPRVVLVEDHMDSADSGILRFMRQQEYIHYCRIGLTRFFLEPEFGKAHVVVEVVPGGSSH